MSIPVSQCPDCGSALPGNRAHGLCPRCVLRFTLSDSPDSDPLTAEANKPDQFGDYELLSELGRGGMGVVYEAKHLSLGRTVALKMLHPSRLSATVPLQRFHQEAEAIAGLDHPNILPVYEVGSVRGQPFFTMKLAERGSLADPESKLTHPEIANRSSRVSCATSVRIVAQISRAIHYAHQRGIQHRDLKPHNILLDLEGRPYVADFGLAKFANRDAGLTFSTDVLGSPAYMSPEQVAGDTKHVSAASDIYGLGAILFELLTGHTPFSAENVTALLRCIVEDEPDASDLKDPDLRTICLKCLSKDPANRYSSAEAVAEELERWERGEPVLARPASTPERLRRWCRRRPALSAALGALAIAIVAGLVGIGLQWKRAETHALQRDVERYVADLQVASQALEGHDLGLARSRLAAQIPKPDQRDPRGVEWYFLHQLCQGQHQFALTGHTATVTCVALTADGRLAASGGMDATIQIWDLSTRKTLATIPAHGTIVWSVGFTRDGTRLVSAGADNQVRFWTSDGRPAEPSLAGQNAALSGDGARLAVSMSSPFRYFEAKPGLQVWDWRARRVLFETNLVVRRVTLSSDGQWLAAGGASRDIYLWNLNTGQQRTLATTDSPWSIAFSTDGKRLAASGFSMGARVWNLAAKDEPPVALVGHRFKVWATAFSPDGHRIVTTGSDRTLQIHDTDSLDHLTVLDGHDDEVWNVAWSQDGTTLITASKDMTLRSWRLDSDAAPRGIPAIEHWHPRFNRDGTRVLTMLPHPTQQPIVALRDTQSGNIVTEFENRSVAGFGANGEDVLIWNDEDRQLERWDATSRSLKPGPVLEGSQQPRVNGPFDISQDGTTIAIGFQRETIVNRVSDGKKRAGLPIPSGYPLLALALSPRGDYLALAVTSPYTLWLHHLSSGRVFTLTNHTEEVKGLAFSADGEMLASAGVDRVIRLWRTRDGELIGELVRYYEEASGVAFSPDGRLLASIGANQSVDLWHVPTRRQVLSINVPNAGLQVTFSPNGEDLAYTIGPNLIRFLKAGKPRATRP